MVNMQAITLFALVLAFCSGSTECRRVQNNEYVLPENDPQEDEVRGYLLRDEMNAKTEGAEPAEQGDENMQSQELYTTGDKVHAYLQQDEENEKRDSAPPTSKTRFKYGAFGTTDCPKGYVLVKDDIKCTTEAAKFFNLHKGWSTCKRGFRTRGCVYKTDGTTASVFFNTCGKNRYTEKMYAPLCEECYTRKARSFVPRGAENVIKIVEGKTLEECKKLCSEEKSCKAIEYFHDYGYRVPGSSVCHSHISHASCGWKPKDCKLLIRSETALTDLNIDVYTRLPSCMPGCWKYYYNRKGQDEIKSYGSKTTKECKQLCQDTKYCKAIADYNWGPCVLYKTHVMAPGHYSDTDLYLLYC